MAKELVVIRQLSNCPPVVTVIIKEPIDMDSDMREHWMNEKADELIEDFKKKFIEFREAEFYKQMVSDFTEY